MEVTFRLTRKREERTLTTTPITGEVFGEERDAPRAYLLAASQKQFSQLKPAMEMAYQAMRSALEGVTETQARFEPAGAGEGEDAWGISQIVRHVAGAQSRNAARLRALALATDSAAPPAAQQNAEDTRTIEALKAALDGSYNALLGAVADVEGKQRLDTTFTHAFFGDLNCRGLFALQTLHANDHARQIDRIKSHPAYAAS